MTERVPPSMRRATPADAAAIADVLLASWAATFAFPMAHDEPDVRRWVAATLLPEREVWVATDPDGRVTGVLALSDAMVEQLYVMPDRIGRGIGAAAIELAKARRPAGLDLYCFAANTRARAFYERHGFEVVAVGDGSGNEEGQPDLRYRWRPGPDLVVPSDDGTPIAAVRSGIPAGPPLLLVHGAGADHTTFRVIGPRLAATHDVWAMDRRGRGWSGDAPTYDIEREFEDVAAIAEAILARRRAGPAAVGATDAIDLFGHSYGGRCALGAALRTSAIRRVISYEGAPSPPETRYGDAAIAAELTAMAARGDLETLLATFMTRVVGMSPAELARYRADPVWPRRVAGAGTIARELAVGAGDAAGLERLGQVRQPVLQLLGGDSLPVFAAATRALDGRLADGRVVVIPGAKHAAHHTHPDAVIAAVLAFLAA